MTSIDKLKELKTMQEVFEYIEETEKGWIISVCDKFSEDYPHLTENWVYLTNELKLKRQKIIIVNGFDTDNRVLFSDLLYSAGFLVRNVNDYRKCDVCNDALPTQQMYNSIQEKIVCNELNVSIPNKWSSKCLKC